VNQRDELTRTEDLRYAEIDALLDELTPEQMDEPGYAGDWSVKDLMAHLGAWCSEASRYFQQMRMGTYGLADEDIAAIDRDIDAINRRFYEASKDLSLHDVKAEWYSSRNQMLLDWGLLTQVDRASAYWFEECGPKHYEEHMPRLREWVAELTGSTEKV
jgi:hypothetical protein